MVYHVLFDEFVIAIRDLQIIAHRTIYIVVKKYIYIKLNAYCIIWNAYNSTFPAGVRDMLEKGDFHATFNKEIMFPTIHDAVIAALSGVDREEVKYLYP